MAFPMPAARDTVQIEVDAVAGCPTSDSEPGPTILRKTLLACLSRCSRVNRDPHWIGHPREEAFAPAAKAHEKLLLCLATTACRHPKHRTCCNTLPAPRQPRSTRIG